MSAVSQVRIDVVPIQLAPTITTTASTQLPHTYYASINTITYQDGDIWLSSTPDGLGELFTDDAIMLTVRHEDGSQEVYSQDYYEWLHAGTRCV